MIKFTRRSLLAAGSAMLMLAGIGLAAPARAQEPIKIGFSMALTGGLASNGKAALAAMQIWEEEVNGRGGLIGRPVKLVYYDDQSNGATVPGIYTKLLDVDKVDLLLSGYSTAAIAPAMPIVIQKKMVFLTLLGFNMNSEFKYDRYFSMIPAGSDANRNFSKGFLEVAATMNPKPKTIAVVNLDAEFPKRASDGLKDNLKKYELKVVYDQSYPPTTVDFLPIIRAVAAAKPDLVYFVSYPVDSAGLIRAIREVGLKAMMVGGGMVGPQIGSFKTMMGPALNNMVIWDTYVPEKTLNFPGIEELLAKYQPRSQGLDPLGFYVPPLAYANMQVLEQAVTKVGKIDQGALAEYMHASTFSTVLGDVKFDKMGEWSQERLLLVQYQNISGNGLDQFKKPGTQPVLYPPQYKSGDLVYPFEAKR
jgi:branched-chain amino acid transport system substrate-binding protein